MKSFLLVLVVLLWLITPAALGKDGQGGGGQGGGGGGGGAGGSTDPTPFEQFVSKLKLDSKKQLPEIETIFTGAATGASSTSQELVTLRARMAEFDDKPTELAQAKTGFSAAAARMTRAEVTAFKQVQKLLKPEQQSKGGEAFVLMAGLFNAPTPRAPRTIRRGGGGQ